MQANRLRDAVGTENTNNSQTDRHKIRGPLGNEQQLPVAGHPNRNQEGDKENPEDSPDELQDSPHVGTQATKKHPQRDRDDKPANDHCQFAKLNRDFLIDS